MKDVMIATNMTRIKPIKAMTQSIALLFFLLLSALFFKPLNAQAQQCAIVPATITTMDEPALGGYNLWDHVSGGYPQDDAYMAAVAKGKDVLIAAQMTEDKAVRAWLLRLDYRGRTLWQSKPVIAHLTAIKAMAAHPQGVAVLASISEPTDEGDQAASALWFGVFSDKDGALLHAHKIEGNAGEGLFADAMLAFPDASGFVIAAHALTPDQKTYTVMYRVDDEGRPDTQRSYRTGEGNRIAAMDMNAQGLIVAAGSAQSPQGASLGWAIGVDRDLKLIWEQAYPRGLESALQAVAIIDPETVAFAGWSKALDTQRHAALIMQTTATGGHPVWERFYRGEGEESRAYEGSAIMVDSQGLISAVLQGQAHPALPELAKDDPVRFALFPYIRLLTLNSRGSVIASEDHRNAHGAFVSTILSGNNENRVMVGATRSADPILLDEAKQAGRSYGPDSFLSFNGWALAVPGFGKYDDPCAPFGEK